LAQTVALLIDGGFVKKELYQKLGRFPIADDITALCERVMATPALAGWELYRVFYYDADPFTGTAVNPLSGQKINFQTTPQARQNLSLIQQLELRPNFAVRRGVLVCHGWKLGRRALSALKAGARTGLSANDLVAHLEQKGVDMRVGLDMASLAIKRLVTGVVLLTGDSDMIPAMKLARREGLRVYLDVMGHPVRRELKVHADILL
jgi:uncharacterized LabA/DUF88 family protein